jgi:hypothetical protein
MSLDPEKLDVDKRVSMAPSNATTLDNSVPDRDLEKPEVFDQPDAATKETAVEASSKSSSTKGEIPEADVVDENRETAADGDASTELEEEYEYPKAMKLTLITLALMFSVFCMALDNTIIAVAIPKITDHFGALNDVGWYGM